MAKQSASSEIGTCTGWEGKRVPKFPGWEVRREKGSAYREVEEQITPDDQAGILYPFRKGRQKESQSMTRLAMNRYFF
jgi:hypothetical protein